MLKSDVIFGWDSDLQLWEIPPTLGRSGASCLGRRSPLLLQELRSGRASFTEARLHVTWTDAISKRQERLPQTPGVREWVSDSWTQRPWWDTDLLITTFLHSPFQPAASWNLFRGALYFCRPALGCSAAQLVTLSYTWSCCLESDPAWRRMMWLWWDWPHRVSSSPSLMLCHQSVAELGDGCLLGRRGIEQVI